MRKRAEVPAHLHIGYLNGSGIVFWISQPFGCHLDKEWIQRWEEDNKSIICYKFVLKMQFKFIPAGGGLAREHC